MLTKNENTMKQYIKKKQQYIQTKKTNINKQMRSKTNTIILKNKNHKIH